MASLCRLDYQGFCLSKKISVVFCGQIRRPDYLRQAIAHLVRLRHTSVIHEIVVSTWAGELDRYPGMRGTLDKAGIVLVEVAPLKDKAVSVGNVERQIVLLHWGMAALGDSTDYVFKTRPDQPINLFPRLGELFASMIAKIGSRDDVDGALWVARYHSLMPFFIDDRYFFGHRRTVERMTVFSNELVLTAHPHNLIAEVVWYSSYFVRKYPFLRLMMQADWSPPWPSGDFYPVLDKVRDQPFFRNSMALFYYCMDTYFRVGFDGISLQDFAGLEPKPLAVEIPDDGTYHLRCRRQVFDYFDLWDDYRTIAAAGLNLSFAEAESAFDAYDAAMLGEGKFIYRPRISRPDTSGVDLDAQPTGRLGHFPDGTIISFDKVTLFARTHSSLPQREPAGVRVIIRNDSLTPLPSDATHPLKLGYKWFREGEPVWEEFPRIVVGQSIIDLFEVQFSLIAPPRPGWYDLEVDLIYDGLFWFDRPSRVAVHVV